MALEPKKLFQAETKVRDELATVVNSGNFQVSLTYALSEFIIRCNPTQEETVGVRKFIMVLTQLPFADAPIPEFPTRRLHTEAFAPVSPSKT